MVLEKLNYYDLGQAITYISYFQKTYNTLYIIYY